MGPVRLAGKVPIAKSDCSYYCPDAVHRRAVHQGPARVRRAAARPPRLILNSEEDITLTAQADIWSLGASLWWAWTRTTPITYTDPAAGRTAQLKDIAAAGRLDPSVARPWPFKEFEQVVIACMATDPRDRPTAEHVATALR